MDTARRALPALALLAGALLYPFAVSGNQDLLDASIQALAYVIMALGLNVVVGFAGLLDLGYVAFYVIGAFVIAWLGSRQFADVNGGGGPPPPLPGPRRPGPPPPPRPPPHLFLVRLGAAP